MPNVNDTQLILLSTAAQREDGSLLPHSEKLTASTTNVGKAIGQLIKWSLVEEGEVGDASVAWRSDGDIRYGVRITDAGRAAIGLADPSTGNIVIPPKSEAAPAERKQTKNGLLLELLQRKQGATLDELVAATSWLPHTTRAALTVLRKKGHTIVKDKRGDATCYTIQAMAA